jgi:hypothetical protein
MKYRGELLERWYCGTWFERISDGNDEGIEISSRLVLSCGSRKKEIFPRASNFTAVT